MLTAAPSFSVDYNHLSVFFPFSARAKIAFRARLVKALDPFGPMPPDLDTLRSVTSSAITAADLATLNKLTITTATSGGKYEERVAGIATNPTFAGFMTFASWLSMGALVTPAQGRLFGDPAIAEALDRLCQLHTTGADDRKSTLSSAASAATPSTDGGYLSTSEASDLQLLTLWCSYHKMMASYLTKAEDTPAGSPKDVYPQVIRIQKLITFIVAARHSIEVCALREHAALLLSPAIRPFFDFFNKTVREEVISYAERVLQLKVHPWMAAAQTLNHPVKRATQWGKQNVTMGLATSKRLGSLWDNLRGWQQARPDSAMDMRNMLLDRSSNSLVMSFFKKADELLLFRSMLNQTYLAEAESVLGLELPGAAPHVHLDGQEWKAIVMTGAESTEALDEDALLLRPRFPLFDAEGSGGQLMGGTTAFEYDAKTWVEGGSPHYHLSMLSRPSSVPPLFVAPHRPAVLAGFSMGQLLPEMFVPVIDSEYFGDNDAAFVPYTLEGLAKAMGYATAAGLLATKDMTTRIGKLFTYQDTATGEKYVKTVPDATRLFYSVRTEQPWRKAVEVPIAIPTETLALDQVTAPVLGPVQAAVIRTKEKPILTHYTLAETDALAQRALVTLGFDRLEK